MRTHEEAEKLFNEYMGVAYSVSHKVRPWFRGYYFLGGDDILQLCLMELWKAAQKWDPGKCKDFVAYAATSIRFALINYLRGLVGSRRNRPTVLPCGELEEACVDACDAEDAACALADFSSFASGLTDTALLTLDLTARGYTQQEIANIRGVSQPCVFGTLRRARRNYERGWI